VEDAETIHRIYHQDGFIRYLPNDAPPPKERVEAFVGAQARHWAEHGYGWWAVTLPGSPELIGWGGLQFLPETSETEVAFFMAAECRGNGYATELSEASLRMAFEDLGFESIIALVHPENMASRRVIEKSGMAFVDEVHYFGMDLCRYIIARERHVRSD